MGNKTGITRSRRGLQEESGAYGYGYDAIGRLESVTKDGDPLRRYQYDAFGNRTRLTEKGQETAYAYNALNQLVSKRDVLGETSYQYDRRGNLTRAVRNGDILHQYTYGALNRLERAVNGKGEAASYQYNGLGYRTGKTEGKLRPETTKYLEGSLDPLSQLKALKPEPEKTIRYTIDLTREYHNLLEKEENQRRQVYLWDGNAAGFYEEGKESPQYYLQDELGSPLRIEGEDGSLMESYGYDEFGCDLYGNQGEVQPFGYTGYQHDGVAGTYFAQAREYQVELGRFNGEDRIAGIIENSQTLNKYTYCVNEPIKKTDRTGYWFGFDDFVAGFVGGIVGGVGQFVSDGITSAIHGKWELSSIETYIGAVVGGAVGGVASLYVTPAGGAAIAAGTSTLVGEGLEKITGTKKRSITTILIDTGVDTFLGGALGKVSDVLGLDKLIKVPKITSGRNSFSAVFASGMTKLRNGTARKMSLKVFGKGVVSESIKDFLPNVLSTLVGEVKEQKDKIFQWGKDTYENISKWIASSIEQINSLSEEKCVGGET